MIDSAELPAEALRDPDSFRTLVMERCEPVVLRGVAHDWPLLADGDVAGVVDQLRRYDAGRDAEVFVGDPAMRARYHYDEALEGFNFTRTPMPFRDALTRIVESAGQPDRPSMYMGSLTSETYLPGIEQATRLAFVPPHVRPRIWIGHPSIVACHYDTMDNVACVAAGRRRFTLFPPDAIRDLYVGPIDHTLAGQPISLAMGSEPGDPRFPRFEQARGRAVVVDLEAGDALYLPKLWWHQVEATGDFNILVNYWWDGFAAGPDQPYAAMMLALIAIADRPAGERAAWRAWFDHYVFRPDGHPLAFLPPEKHGVLEAGSKAAYGRIRTMVMRMLRGA
ncbi:Cupin-like domain-containing protein [Sphingomonas gellani]|uniref:Cupin-like domain-containing protein n=1 Tax=Sphingomonas gellani TaxID=1166340 RepID=A0A1H8DIX2_9SPHN|nr:cupin-like domain-containing protein [Sphingomonas gellani]SEN07229.1 Cupin-like domain-containing protein [Sphingomonas gellani]